MIEKVKTEDAEELLAIYAPYVKDTAISFEYEVPAVEEFRERIRQISAKYPYIKMVEDGKIMGYAYANIRGHGTGRMLYEQLEKSLKSMGILNMNACIAYTDEEDEHLTNDSYFFHKKMGFELVGTFHKSGYKFDRWYDMIWMEKMIGEHMGKAENVKFGEWEI